ncbi:hypothetical protein HI914_04054 [Erysiphe necator]|nr:hypothetical protein HI914_04054 [Erysiphe necator]
MPNHQNLSALPISRYELERVLESFFNALKIENDELRKEVENLRQGMNNICKEMRSTFLAQRPIEIPGPTSRQSNRVDNSNVDEEISVSSQGARHSTLPARHPTLPPRPPTADINTPALPISPIRTQKQSSQTFHQTKSPKLYSKVVTVSSEKPWTVVGSLSAKSKKTQGSNSFPTPLKAPRPERERRIIFRRRANMPPPTRNVAIEILYRLNKALQSKKLPAYMRFLKLGYNSAGNLTGLVSENATANMLLPNYGDILLKTVLELDKDVKEVVEDLEWIPLKIHSVEIERYHRERENGLEQLRRELLTGPSELDLPFTPRWISSRERFEYLVNTMRKKHSSVKIIVRTRDTADRLLAKGVWFGGACHRVEPFRQIGPDSMCPTCCHWGHTTYNCPNPGNQRCELCAGAHLSKNHQCAIIGCNKGRGKSCIHLTMKCANCDGKHMASSHSCRHYREATAIAKGNREEWKAREKSRETALQAEEVESCAADEDLEEQDQREDGAESGSQDRNNGELNSEFSKTTMEESMEGIQEEFSYETRADLELPL